MNMDDEVNNAPHESGFSLILIPFRCVSCKRIPFFKIYKCRQNHVLCSGCYHNRLLDKSLGVRFRTCPECGVLIYWNRTFCNYIVKSELDEVYVTCRKCNVLLQRKLLHQHNTQHCVQRIVACNFKRLGCNWKGTVGTSQIDHAANCKHCNRTGAQMLEQLRHIQRTREEKRLLVSKVMKLKQQHNVTVRLLFHLSSDGDFPCNQFVKGSFFEAFNMKWSVHFKWQVSNDAENRHDDIEPSKLHCRLSLEAAEGRIVDIHLSYTVISTVFSDVNFQPNISENWQFTNTHPDGPTTVIYENSCENVMKLIFDRGIFARIFMTCIR